MLVRIFGFFFGLAGASVAGYWVYRLYDEFLASVYFQQVSEVAPAWWLEIGAPTAFVLLGVLAGFLVSSAVFRILATVPGQLRTVPPAERITGVFGIFLGLGLTALSASVLSRIAGGWTLVALLAIPAMYLGWVVAASLATELQFLFPGLVSQSPQQAEAPPKLLDTSVIIDGRIADISRTGFLEGALHVPGFVLEELQSIADSADTLKRNRGRRGLDVLNHMRKEYGSLVSVLDRNPANSGASDAVDVKLVRLAQEMGAAIITNDYNLNKVAQLRGVDVLNVNELANAVKPVVLPGEGLTVSLIKEGKEMEQAVGYLDDGTMVVVENGKPKIGQTLDVIVSSVLQTVAGKMIFANLPDEYEPAKDRAHGSRGGPRGRERHTSRS